MKVDVLGPGARICGPDVLDRMKRGTIRPNLSTTKLRYLSAAESGAGVPCVIAEEIGVYERPITPPIDPDIALPPPDLRKPEVLAVGERICRPDVGMLVSTGQIEAASGARLVFYKAGPGNPCVKAILDTVVVAPPDLRKPSVEPDIFMPPPTVDITAEPGLRKPSVEPDIFMPPPKEVIPLEHRAGYEPTYLPPGVAPSTVIASAEDGGPLGLPWIVWVGAAGLLVTLLSRGK